MKIKDYKCKCGHDDFFFADKGNQTGIYCSYCGKWLKWADKDEQNLKMKQVSVLDKIKAEIREVAWDSNYGEEIAKDMVVDLTDVLTIIDKYKEPTGAESEG